MKTGIVSSRFALVIAAALAASVSGCGVGEMEPDETLLAAAEVAVDSSAGFEAETMTRLSGRLSIEADSSASAGSSLVFYRNGSAVRSFSASSELSAVVIVARGEQCQGAPRLRVVLDGAQIQQIAVASSSWGEYRAAVRIPAGAHRLEVGFDNDFHKSGVCDRNLRIDRVRFEAAAVVDAGALDAGSADAASTAPDGGTTVPDAGSTAADAGSPPADAGSTTTDASTAAGASVRFEAERMSLPAGGVAFSDPAASGGQAVRLWNAGSATLQLSLAAPATRLAVRALGESCNGAPSMQVSLDGQRVLESAVASTTWTELSADISVAAGSHSLQITYPNDFYSSSACDRNLVLDWVRFDTTSGAACVPTTCASTGATCGTIADGCGNSLSCGSCASGQTCGAANSCVTTPPAPNPTTGATYHVDPAGSDSNSGISPSAPWASIAKVAAASLQPGDAVLFKRGASFSGTLKLSRSGLDGKPITIGSYGTGALPVLSSVNLTGSYLELREVQVDYGAWAGVDIYGSHNRVERCLITRHVTGIFLRPSATHNAILDNDLTDNNRMSVLTSGGDDDSGAFGILLQGDDNEIARNRISGSDAFSYDYGRDGAAVEVYGGQRNHIHHNSAWACDAFTELGNSRSADNTFAYNTFRSSNANSIFLVTRGASSSWGPVLRTRVYNNTVQLNGAQSQGFVCHGGCSSSVLVMRNNVIEAVLKAGYADAAFDEDYNLFSGATQFPRGAHSFIGSPQFRSVATGDLRLQPTSPAVDRGVGLGYAADLDGAVVPHDGNGDGLAAPDLGAYELH